ncbi:MAG: AAA family ATPase, partial [Candidatus Thiodiazotropha sp.]
HEWEQKQVWHLDPNRIIAGMSTVGAWQKRLTAMIESCRNRFEFSKKIALRLQRDILLFDNPVALLRVGKAARSNMCLANILKIYAEERSVGLVLEATPEEWRLVQELDRGFADLFQVIRVQEPDKAETVQILAARRCLLEQKYQCAIEHKAFALIIELHERHLQSAIRPGSQVRMLERLMARHADSKIQLADVMDDFRGLSHMYSHLFDSSKLLDPDEVGNAIKKGLVGQEKALHCLVDTVMMVKAGLNSPGKPVASYLFVGPTGVGKTEAAKALTRYLFEDEQHLVRFNMNEFMDNQAASRLIGGRGSQEGQLTVKVRYSSFCILLLDEIEKAHPDVHDLLLQVLGEGRLTDAMGRTTDFSHSIIIMTSNIGATDASKTIGFTSDGQDQAQTYRNKAEDFFRPEFFNRIDQVIDFHPLTLEETKTIIRLMITRLLTRHGFISRSVVLNVSEIALDSVASQGHDPAMGARAVKRNLEKEVTQLAAAKLVELPVGQPTVMDIYARYGKLVPKIHALQYAQVNPDYVEQVNLLQKLDRHCLKTLLEQFGQLQTDLDSYRDELENNTGKKIWTLITEDKNESYTADETRLIELYRIRETLIEYIEELQLFNEAEELEKLPRNPVRPFTVRKIKYYSRDWGEEVVYKD